MKEQACPNCGAASPKVIREGEFRCTFCDTLYTDQAIVERRRSAEKKTAYSSAKLAQYNVHMEQARTVNNMGKRILLFVAVFLVIIFAFVGFMVFNSMKQQQKMQEEMIKSFQPQK